MHVNMDELWSETPVVLFMCVAIHVHMQVQQPAQQNNTKLYKGYIALYILYILF